MDSIVLHTKLQFLSGWRSRLIGYSSVASFSAAYKRYFGVAPSKEWNLENRT